MKNKIKYVLYALICVLLCALSYVFGLFRFGGITPQYAICGIIAVAMFEREKTGAIFGLIFGLLADFSTGSLFGVNAIVYMFAGYVTGYIVAKLFTVNFISCCLIVFAVILIVDMITLLVGFMLYGHDFSTTVIRIILFKELLTIPVSVGVYFLMRLVATNPKWRTLQ